MPVNHPPEVLRAARLLGPALGRKASDPGTLRLAAAVLSAEPEPAKGDVYAMIRAAGIDHDHWQSDLYVIDTPESRRILDAAGANYRPFIGSHGGRWLDVPLSYTPFWDKAKANTPRSPWPEAESIAEM